MSTVTDAPAGSGDTPPAPAVALMFAGQGSQHQRMAAGLYGADTVFTEWMDRAFELLEEDGPRLRSAWLSADPQPEFDDVTVAQPLLYAVSHALGRMVLSWDVRPVALIGHSVGEMVAATLAGVLDLADGIWLMRDRVHLFARTPPGGMLAVAATVKDVEPVLGDDVFVAAVNAPRQLLLAGERLPLERAAAALRERGHICRMAAAKQAFHSPVVADAVRRSISDWSITPLRSPQLPLYSAYTEDLLDTGHALDAVFWAKQPGETVFFASTLDRLLAEHDCLLLEAGPGQTLTMLARRHPSIVRGDSRAIALLPERDRGEEADLAAVQKAIELVAPARVPDPRPTHVSTASPAHSQIGGSR